MLRIAAPEHMWSMPIPLTEEDTFHYFSELPSSQRETNLIVRVSVRWRSREAYLVMLRVLCHERRCISWWSPCAVHRKRMLLMCTW